MNFLHPTFLIGLAVSAIPLLAHLLRQRRMKRVRFSTLYFLRLLHKRHSLRIRVDQILLLIVRMSVAAVVTLLFAQPFFTDPALSFLNSGPRHVVVLLDNSGSLGVKTQGGVTLFEQSLLRLSAVTDSLSEREALTVVALAPRAEVVFRGKPGDLADGQRPRLHAGKADLEGGLRLARTAFAGRPGTERVLIVISDFVAMPLESIAAPGADVLLYPVRSEGVGNVACGPLVLDADQAVAGELLTVRLELARHGAPREARASLFLGDEVRDQRYVAPGAGPAAMVFTVRPMQPGLYPIRVQVGEDSLPGDDATHSVLEVLEQRRVQIVTGRALPPAEGVRHPLFFLERALPRATLSVSQGVEKLEGASMVIVLRPDLLSDEQSRELLAHVEAGGNVLVTLGPDEVDPEAANRALFEAMGHLRLGRKVEETAPWRASPASASELMDPRYWGGVSSSVRFLLEPGEGFRRDGVRLAFDDGTPAVHAARIGRGRVTVMNAGVGVGGCDLPLHPIFPIFLNDLVSWTAESRTVVEAGEEVSFTLPIEDYGARFQVVAPGEKVFAVSPERRGSQLVATFRETALPGLYRLDRIAQNARTSRYFVVRWPASESGLDYPDDQTLAREVAGARIGGAGSGLLSAGRLPMSFSELLLAATVLLLLAESWLVYDLERQISRQRGEGSDE